MGLEAMNFNEAIDRVLSSEGGYVNDPNDPGLETQWGISKRSYPNVDIKNLTRDEAKQIYKRDFWDPVANAGIHGDVVFQVLDFAVNSGGSVAVQYLQRAVGVADDGHLGPVSVAAINDTPMPVLLLTYLALRLEFMTKLKNWPHAGKGWARRIADNMLYAAEDLLK